MKYFIYLSMIWLIPAGLLNAEEGFLIRRQGYIQIAPLVQSWKMNGNQEITAQSVPVKCYLPLGRSTSISISGSQIQAEFLSQNLSSFADIQLTGSHYFESLQLMLNLGVNLPTGQQELTPEEFSLATILAQNHLNFKVPGAGQGMNFVPGVSWATPVGEKLVIGLGAAFQQRGKYKPLAGMTVDFDPGDELLFTGGLDLRVNERTTISVDFSYTQFAADKIAGETIFISGEQAVARLRFKRLFNFNELQIHAQYLYKAKNQLDYGGIFQQEPKNSTPGQFLLNLAFRARFSRSFHTLFLAEYRKLEETINLPGITVFSAGFMPEIKLFASFWIQGKFMYRSGIGENSGKMTGTEMGVGLQTRF